MILACEPYIQTTSDVKKDIVLAEEWMGSTSEPTNNRESSSNDFGPNITFIKQAIVDVLLLEDTIVYLGEDQ